MLSFTLSLGPPLVVRSVRFPVVSVEPDTPTARNHQPYVTCWIDVPTLPRVITPDTTYTGDQNPTGTTNETYILGTSVLLLSFEPVSFS